MEEGDIEEGVMDEGDLEAALIDEANLEASVIEGADLNDGEPEIVQAPIAEQEPVTPSVISKQPSRSRADPSARSRSGSDIAPIKESKAVSAATTSDALLEEFSFGWIDVGMIMFSIITFLADIASDIVLAVWYLQEGFYPYFCFTMAFVIVPAIIMTLFSFRWYLSDMDRPGYISIPWWKWGLRTFFLMFQIGPILRYIDCLSYGIQCRIKMMKGPNVSLAKQWAKYYYQLMIYEDLDVTNLRLFETFMEAAPQIVLQLSILAANMESKFSSNQSTFLGESKQPLAYQQKTYNIFPSAIWLQILSISFSLISIAWALTYYNRMLRISMDDKSNLSMAGTVWMFGWQFFTIAFRVMALALFTSVYELEVIPIIFAHWLVMTLWILYQETQFCDTRFEEFFYDCIIGAIYIFCFFNVKEDVTRFKYMLYYIVFFAENAIFMTLWLVEVRGRVKYAYPTFVAGFVFFFIGIVFMITYYAYFHPNSKIKFWPVIKTKEVSEMLRPNWRTRSSPGAPQT